MITSEKNSEGKGHYFGTEINEKWWKRYSNNKMLARGKGNFWYDNTSFSFLRLLTKDAISILFEDIVEFKIGKWHAGQWGAGKPILKIVWLRNNQRLSSGFMIDNDEKNVIDLINRLKVQIEIRK